MWQGDICHGEDVLNKIGSAVLNRRSTLLHSKREKGGGDRDESGEIVVGYAGTQRCQVLGPLLKRHH